MRTRALSIVVSWFLAASGCDGGSGADAGRDSSVRDGGRQEAGVAPDAGMDDGGAGDAGPLDDGGREDGGSDGGADAGPGDAGTSDAGTDPATIPAPLPIEPSSGAFTTSPTVRFRWALSGPATGARLEICRDRTCAEVREVLDVEGDTTTTLVPPDPGATSRVFYFRLTGRAGEVLGASSSAVWSFSVHGRVAVSSGATWGTLHDFDGDGLSDILGGAPASSTVRLYRGRSPIGTAGVADSSFAASPPLQLGTVVAGVGDVNGDGMEDLALGTATGLLIFHGMLGGFPASVSVASASTTIAVAGPSRATVAAAGDVDRDGYADVVIGDPAGGRVLLHRGGPAGLEAAGTPLVRSEAGFGASVAGGCDVDADGHADVIVGSTAGALVLFGDAAGLGDAIELTPPAVSAGFGASVACAGDVDGDGFPDVIVGAPDDHAAFVFHGRADGISSSATGSLRKLPGMPVAGTTWHGSRFGASVAAAGDVNGDGFGDVVVVAPDPPPPDPPPGFIGSAFVFHGRSGGFLVTAPDSSTTHNNVVGATPVMNRAQVSQYAGDLDGDGYGDLVTGAPEWSGGGALLLNRGSPTGPAVAVTWLLGGSSTITGLGTTIASLAPGWLAPRPRIPWTNSARRSGT